MTKLGLVWLGTDWDRLWSDVPVLVGNHEDPCVAMIFASIPLVSSTTPYDLIIVDTPSISQCGRFIRTI
ncbi:hypothetical protein L6452_29897 [Arctium lappa]|uniref:Uncharacterized protein n=1 Tax=Arctium lappa TaxID=4217 RepID=A0ACB8ZIN9_ARCLA|nr:hypothetical protein L6452_29897 [Arctium lappa]